MVGLLFVMGAAAAAKDDGSGISVCHHWTETDKAQFQRRSSEKDVCESHNGTWYQGGAGKPPGACPDCWCCKPGEADQQLCDKERRKGRVWFYVWDEWKAKGGCTRTSGGKCLGWTDKIGAGTAEECPKLCGEVNGCGGWFFGKEGGMTKCWLREHRPNVVGCTDTEGNELKAGASITDKEWQEAFSHYDSNKDGQISEEELHDDLISIGQNPSEVEMKYLMDKMDADGNGSISFEELKSFRIPSTATDKDFHETFKDFDKDENGYIDASDKTLFNETDLTDGFLEGDENKDGKMDLEEFKLFATSY